MCFSIEDKDLLVKTHQLGNCLLGRWWLGQGGGVGAPRWEGETSSGCESGMNNIYWGTQVLGWWSLVMSTVIIFLVWTDRNVKFTFCPDSKAETTQLCQIRLEQRVYSWGVMSGIDMETLSTIKAWWNTLYLQLEILNYISKKLLVCSEHVILVSTETFRNSQFTDSTS